MVDNLKSKENRDISIGDVAKLTGISVFKLRTWERRYNSPISLKLSSGHRRFSQKDVLRLKQIKIALDSGAKISKLIYLSDEDLLAYNCKNTTPENIVEESVHSLIKKANLWDDQSLYNLFEEDWNALGPIGFINARAARLLNYVGEGWEKGDISVSQEHFISEILEKFLSEKWSKINNTKSSRKVLLASLEGEKHSFGLHFCAVTSVYSGMKAIFLGSSLPDNEIIETASESGSFAVCLSISIFYESSLAIKKIKKIRKELPSNIELIVGGSGAPLDIDGVRTINHFQVLYEWLKSKQLGFISSSI